MATKNAAETQDIINLFALAGAPKKPAAAAAKAAAKEVTKVSATEFSVIYDGAIIDTVVAKTKAGAQKKADADYEEPVVVVAADADKKTLVAAKKESRALAAAEEQATKPAAKAKAPAAAKAKAPAKEKAPAVKAKPKAKKDPAAATSKRLQQKYARRKAHRWLRDNGVDYNLPITMRATGDGYVFAVETDKKPIYLGLNGDDVQKIQASVFKTSVASA